MSDEYTNPDLLCDIVMKGGITSGVVYPGAVLRLAKRYRFKSVGGASAGGIAAAVVAAAEYARDQGGFTKLEALPTELASTPGGRPFMLQLFQADPATRPLFSVMISVLEHKLLGALSVLRQFWRFPVLAALVAIASILATVLTGADAVFAVAGAFVALVVLLVGLVLDIVRAVGRLPTNDFGLCRLGPQAGTAQAPALTAWLHERIQETAGRQSSDPPLTFADLWVGPKGSLPPLGDDARLTELQRLSADPAARVIDLQMMTTDLSHGRPMRLPVPVQPFALRLEAGGGLLFSPDELRRFFPSEVVEHLIACAPPVGSGTAANLQRLGRTDLLHFPIGPDLPVVVATRMTLSFPVLISAIPLYQLDYRKAEPPLVRVLFSDGGITSNFPVHFFDSPLPSRPTFGLNLIGFEPGEVPDPDDPCQAVVDPVNVNKPAYAPIVQIDGLATFFTAIKDAMQNWRDNAQAQLPGFRDRVAQIKLAKGEGGLNLTMDEDKIKHLNQRGACAGEHLVTLFAGDGGDRLPQHWNDHRFVRYRTTMSLIERLLAAYSSGYNSPPDPVTIPYPERIEQGTVPPYPLPSGSIQFARDMTDAYLKLAAGCSPEGNTLDDKDVPRPPSTLRTVPPV